jgi:lathosterol oxidase
MPNEAALNDSGVNQGSMSREWNYHPDLPLADPSIFQWPPRAGFLAAWLA